MINSKIKIISTIVSIGLLIILFATLNYKNTPTSYLNIDGLDIDSLDDYPPSIQMYHLIEKYSREYDVPKWVVYNISYRETRYLGPFHWCYNPYQVSKSGALDGNKYKALGNSWAVPVVRWIGERIKAIRP